MKDSNLTENLVKLFSDLEIQYKSGVDIASESSLLLSSKGIAKEMEKRYRKKMQPEEIERIIASNDIEILGSTGYGPKSRTTQVVSFGRSLFGLNTENNVREALRRYFVSNGYQTVIEFDAGIENAMILSQPKFSVRELKIRRNGRDLLAVKFLGNEKDIWLIELKGHSGVESWDFFTGLKQLLVLLDLRTRIVNLDESNAVVRCAFAIPIHNVKAHGGKSCYSKELSKLAAIMKNPTSYERFVGMRTYEYLVKAIKKYRLIELLTKDDPIVHFLTVKRVDSVTNFTTNKRFIEFLL